ncbi:hypothetical protein KKC91_11940 [bacterium]|nr:hypothetical protein [bacterium]MBU1852673.1 hypothetical protein [Candidatus Omnitrophota bacterium]
MNKLRLLFLTMLLAGLILSVGASVSLAETDTEEVDVAVTISSTFGFTVDDTSLLTFNAGSPVTAGAEYVADRALGIIAQSNNGVAWTMELAGGPLGETGGATLDQANFRFWHTTDNGADPALPEGTLTPTFGTDAPMTASDQLIYQSTLAEGTDEYIALGVGLKIIVPADQQAGDYTTSVTLTMTDST